MSDILYTIGYKSDDNQLTALLNKAAKIIGEKELSFELSLDSGNVEDNLKRLELNIKRNIDKMQKEVNSFNMVDTKKRLDEISQAMKDISEIEPFGKSGKAKFQSGYIKMTAEQYRDFVIDFVKYGGKLDEMQKKAYDALNISKPSLNNISVITDKIQELTKAVEYLNKINNKNSSVRITGIGISDKDIKKTTSNTEQQTQAVMDLSAAYKTAKNQLNSLLTEMSQADVASSQSKNAIAKVMAEFADGIDEESSYLDPAEFVRYFQNGIDILKEYDSALTRVSYTMDVSRKSLDNLGENVLDLANDMRTSVQDAMAVSQIYANMETTPKKIVELAQPAIVMSNLTGADVSTTSDQIQAVVQEFGLLEEESMHIADVYDYIGAHVSIDYSKGIESIGEAVKVAGSTAAQAGLSFEQLSAITARVSEKTNMEGSSIGNVLKTLFTRLSKVGELSDEADNETLNKASASLRKIGVEVYNLDGSYREFDTIMGELAAKWDGLTAAEQANISFNIAATRQTSLLSALLSSYADSMQLATEATETQGNALANQEKYEQSYAGRLQAMSTALQTVGINLLYYNYF